MGRRFKEQRSPDRAVERLGAALAQLCAATHTPGAATTVWLDGRQVSACTGLARLDGAVVEAGTVFAYSSVTKVFTAALVARLAERGALAYGDAVTDHVAELVLGGGAGEGITVEHLVTHTAGFEGPEGATAGEAGASAMDYVRALAAFEPYAPPGALFGYSSAGYVVLAEIVERVTGVPYLDALRSELLDPAGVAVADIRGFHANEAAVGHAVDHATHAATPTPLSIYPAALDAAGGLWGTSAALVDFGRLFLDERMPAAAKRPLVARPEGAAEQLAQGLAWRHSTWDGEPLWWHTGGSPGHACKLTVVPGHRVVVATTTNAGLVTGHAVTGRIEDWLLYHLCGVERPEPPPPAPAELPLAAYAGRYCRHARELHVEVADVADGAEPALVLTSVPTENADPHLRRITARLTSRGGHLFHDDAGRAYHFAVVGDGTAPTHLVSRGFVARRAGGASAGV